MELITEYLQQIIIGILLIAFGVFLTKPLENLKTFIENKWFKISNKFSKNKNIVDYFHTPNGLNSTEIVVFQFGLRDKLPVLDILYLELLKKMLREQKIKKIVIFATLDKSAKSQIIRNYENFKNNIKSVFCEYQEHIEFIDPFRKSELTSAEIIDVDFIDTLNYLNSKEFYKEVEIISKKRVKGIQDFNKFHPKEKSVMTLVTHVFKAWEVREYILEYIKTNVKDKINIGFVFWQLEYDKWGIYSRTAKDKKINELRLIIGKTVYCRNYFFQKLVPIPVFIPNETIGLFDVKESIFEKIVSKHSKAHVIALIEIITAILKDNYEEEIKSKKHLSNESEDLISSLSSSSIPFGKVFTRSFCKNYFLMEDSLETERDEIIAS